jgi:GrpB-like predicted nucleotidyltransferase (UPF0157 family)
VASVGAETARQTFAPYDPEWPRRFAELATPLREALPDAQIEHYGSTSVPGLGGRPILDVQVAVPDIMDLPRYQPALEALGFVPFVPEDLASLAESGMVVYVPKDGTNAVHIAVCALGGFHQRRQLAVRDYLRAHPDEAREYAEVKRQAAAEAAGVRARYAAGKGQFVAALQERALSWAGMAPSGGTQPA